MDIKIESNPHDSLMPSTVDRYAVFGDPISHSKSPRIHRLFAEQTGQKLVYTAQQVPMTAFTATTREFFDNGGKGLNCTVPLKELAWQFADQCTERARMAKAVNTLHRLPDGSILGDNTDGVGLVKDLTENHGVVLHGTNILILGAGGASRGIIAPLLKELPQRLVIANRSEDKAINLAAEFANTNLTGCGMRDLKQQKFDVILNATSASLSGELPDLPLDLLTLQGTCYDLAYANRPTPFVRWGRDQHAKNSLDGLGMLVEQAAAAFFLWRNVYPDTTPVIKILNAERDAC
jgi:shikimate dehydrogenase